MPFEMISIMKVTPYNEKKPFLSEQKSMKIHQHSGPEGETKYFGNL